METVILNTEKVKNYLLETKINDLDIVHFLQNNVDNELILHAVDKYQFTYTVKETEKSKTYVLPAILFSEPDELDENVNTDKNKQNVISKIFFHKDEIIKYGGIALFIAFIVIKPLFESNANFLTTGPLNEKIQVKEKTQVEILTEKLNKNNIDNALKKEQRKKLLDDLKTLDSKIQETEKNNSLILENINLITK